MQRHLGRHVFQRLHLEVRGSHPGLDRPERMLDRLAAERDCFGIVVESLLNALEDGFMFPSAEAAFDLRPIEAVTFAIALAAPS